MIMKKSGFKIEHKIGIVAIVCLLLGGLIAFIYMYLNGNEILIFPTSDNKVYQLSSRSRVENKTNKTQNKTKRFSIFNYYYQQNGKIVEKEVQRMDSLPELNKEGYHRIVRTSNENIILDLNTCDTFDLQMIRGIGPVYSRRIYKYREKLGGYVSVSQLREIYGIEEEKYQSIKKNFIIGEKKIRKVNINSMNVKELAAHPYIDWYLAKEIIVFHQNYGEFTDINQLKAVHLMNDTIFDRLKMYIEL